jgi:nicotinate-nucleotide pyrophosphorylase (carboxylating)
MGQDTSIHRYLNEDLGKGDVTTNSLLGKDDLVLKAVITAEEDCIAAGLDEAEEVFHELKVHVMRKILDGEPISKGTEVMTLQGGAKGILAGERVALNFIMQMSGIATTTSALVKKCKRLNPDIKIAATRKTTPGFRHFEKKAVAVGGGSTHRYGLDDMVLIKDNHLLLVPSVTRAIKKVRHSGYAGKLEIEVTTQEMAEEAAKAGADIIMLDNFEPERAAKAYRAVKKLDNDIQVEISGGINEKNILQYAKHADIISMGALTHSARSLPFHLTVLGIVEDEEAKRAKKLAEELSKDIGPSKSSK